MTRRSLGRALSIPSNTFRPSQKRRKFTNVEAYLLPGWIKSRKRSFLLPLQSSLSFLFALLGPDWNLALVQAHLVWYSSEAWPSSLGVTACTRLVSLVCPIHNAVTFTPWLNASSAPSSLVSIPCFYYTLPWMSADLCFCVTLLYSQMSIFTSVDYSLFFSQGAEYLGLPEIRRE